MNDTRARAIREELSERTRLHNKQAIIITAAVADTTVATTVTTARLRAIQFGCIRVLDGRGASCIQ